MTDKEPREHGLIFGRGDELPDGTEEPPTGRSPFAVPLPGYGPVSTPFGDPPPEEIELVGDIPWELRDDPDEGTANAATKPAGPVVH
jgi:hypothetical protein